MSIKNTNSRWGWIAQGFHWPIALLIFAAWATFELHDNAPKHSQQSSYWLGIHKSLGISVFFLVWLRLIWRFVNKAPADIGLAPWQRWTSHAVHLSLYLLMIGVPVTGILTSEYGGHPASWFGLFDLPAFVEQNKDIGRTFHFMHTDVFWLTLLGLLGLHVVAAFWHHIFLKDSVLRRMLPWRVEH